MLKIKDSVDLNVLEEYGFVLNTTEGKERYERVIDNSNITFSSWWGYTRYGDIIVLPISRKVVLNVNGRGYNCTDLAFDRLDGLYDLIQAGLVEKVEGK